MDPRATASKLLRNPVGRSHISRAIHAPSRDEPRAMHIQHTRWACLILPTPLDWKHRPSSRLH